MQKAASSARWQSHAACCGTSPRGINVQGGHKVKEIPNLCSPDNGYSINLRVLFSIHLFPTGVKIPLRRKHGNMNEERCIGVKLVNIHRLEFTMCQVRTTSKHTCTSAKATRGRAHPLSTCDTICVLHSALVQPSHFINPVCVSSQELWLPAGESPGDPSIHQLSLLAGALTAAESAAWPRLKVLVLWRVSGQSLSWRGNVEQRLLSQIRCNESRCVIKRSSQEAGLELSDDCLKGFYFVIWVKTLDT